VQRRAIFGDSLVQTVLIRRGSESNENAKFMPIIIEMTGVEKKFPGVHALKGAQFELQAGEVHALMGENGAGKSTLMKILAGIYQPDRGDVRIYHTKVSPRSPRDAQQLGIGFIHQELCLMDDLTAAQNIFIGREPRLSFGRVDETALNRQAIDIFASMNVDLNPRSLVGHLTIAKQQMIEIAKALSFKPRVLIMDEPTAALNDAEIAELFMTIRRLKSEGVGIIYIAIKWMNLTDCRSRHGDARWRVRRYRRSQRDPVSTIIAMMVGRKLTATSTETPDLSEATTALEVIGLNRGQHIRDISFSLKKGEILGFAGLMGAGRTEVARAIFGADRKDSGEIRVHGTPCIIDKPVDAVRLGIGYLSEDRKRFGLATGMSIRDNIALASLNRFSGKIGQLDEDGIRGAARSFICTQAIRTPSDQQEVRLLSGGNQQKVVIAKWLLADCDILIFDEPTRGIDIGAKSEIYALLDQLAKDGKAIIVISSELPEIIRLSHRIAVMCEGRLTGILPGGTNTSQKDIMQLATQTNAIMHTIGNER